MSQIGIVPIMSEVIRVGVAGLTHGHVWGLIDAWKKVPNAQLVAVADATPLLEKAMLDFDKSYEDWREMLAENEFDALLVTSNNVESAEITIEALKKGIPCLVEKAMAANAADADRMLEAQRESGKTLMINWPLAWSPWLYEVKRQLDDGAVGHAFHMRFRNGHSGPKEIGCDEYFVGWLYDEKLNGGGAIADFCSYGAVLARYYFGLPESVYCVRGNFTKDYEVSDDHALITLKYPKMSVSIEGTWATAAFDLSANPVIHGKTGTLAVYGSQLKKHVPGSDPIELDSPALEVGNPAQYFMDCITSGTTPEGIRNPEIAADACRILDAAIRSAASGCAEKP